MTAAVERRRRATGDVDRDPGDARCGARGGILPPRVAENAGCWTSQGGRAQPKWRPARRLPLPVRAIRRRRRCSFQLVAGAGNTQRRSSEKADRRAARELIANYHQKHLRALLEHVRVGFAQLDAGDIDEFDLDDLIHHYKRSAAELWKFCGSSGGKWKQAANMLTYMREHGEEPDWWEMGAPRRTTSS